MPSASLKYTDKTDRAYGLCGASLALFVYDAERFISHLSIDAPADAGVDLFPEFFMIENQNISAKTVWNNQYRRFQVAAAMMIGNLLCRSISRRKSDISREVSNLLLSHLLREGEESCGLDASEVRELLAEPFDYLRKLLRHPRINATMCDMAQELSENRSLERDRVLAYLRPLNRL